MKIRHTLGNEIYHGKQFPMNTVILHNEKNGVEVFCSNFGKQNGKITVLIHIPNHKKFLKTEMRNEYTKEMYNYYLSLQKPSQKLNYKQMMAHDRKRKTGSGGVRLGKFCGQITDYECAKNPLHDFRRVYNQIANHS